MIKILFILTYFFIFLITTRAQKSLIIKVINNKHESIESATVSVNDTIVGITNINGLYAYSYKSNTLQIQISSIGYQKYNSIYTPSEDTLIIKLIEKTISAETVNVRAKKLKEKTIGFNWAPLNGTFHLSPNTAWVNRIELKKQKNVKIKTINYYLKEGKNEDASSQFKVLLLKHDTTCNCPGEPLIDNYIVEGAKKNQWFKVDISKENIYINDEIFYIGLAVMSKNFYEKPIITKYYKNYFVNEYKMPSISFLQRRSKNTFMNSSYPDSEKWSNYHYKFVCTTTVEY